MRRSTIHRIWTNLYGKGGRFADQRGFMLIESLVALALLGIVGTSLLTGLYGQAKGTQVSYEEFQAMDAARSQLEYVMSQPYDATNDPPQYTLLSTTIPASYSIQCSATRLDIDGDGNGDDDGVQQITVTVSRSGTQVVTLTSRKVDL